MLEYTYSIWMDLESQGAKEGLTPKCTKLNWERIGIFLHFDIREVYV